MNHKSLYLARRNPGISREEWPKAWKSHAIFASQFPATGASLEWMRYCNRIDAPTLDGKPVALPMLSTAHDGVANLNTGPAAPGERGFTDDVIARLKEDELRVFDMYVENFSFPSVETPILEGLPGKAALYMFLPRKAGTSALDFKAWLDGDNAALARETIAGVAGLKRYAHNHPKQVPAPPFDFDAVVEAWFETQDDAVRALSQGALDPILADFGTLADMDRAILLLTTPCHAWPKDEALIERQKEGVAS